MRASWGEMTLSSHCRISWYVHTDMGQNLWRLSVWFKVLLLFNIWWWQNMRWLPCPGESRRWLSSPGSWAAGRSCRRLHQTRSGTSAYSAGSALCTSSPHLVGKLSCTATEKKKKFFFMHFVLKRLDGTWTAEDERLNVRLSCGLHRKPNCAWNNQGNRHTAAKNPYPRMAMDSSLCVESMVLMMPQNFCMKNFNLFLCSSIFPATSIATFKRRKLCTAVEHFFYFGHFWTLKFSCHHVCLEKPCKRLPVWGRPRVHSNLSSSSQRWCVHRA